MAYYLPDGYIPCSKLGGYQCYFDTGVVTSNDLNIVGLFSTEIVAGTSSYLFGARNSNSNTSNGQFSLLQGYTQSSGGTLSSSSYLGFASARTKVNNLTASTGVQLINNNNLFSISSGTAVNEITASTSTFTGTRSIYILALHNGSDVAYGSSASGNKTWVREFSMSKGGEELHHYLPVYNNNGRTFGLYDFVTGEFIEHLGDGSLYEQYLLQVVPSLRGGGEAYIINDTIQETTSKYIYDLNERFIAYPKDGYDFLNWTDARGNVLSTERYFEYNTGDAAYGGDVTIYANFIKKTDIRQTNGYQLLGLQYGEGYNVSDESMGIASDIYAPVLSFKCEQDMLTSSTTTIILKEMPSLYVPDMPVFLFSPKGEMLWSGVIKTINGNELTCREPISIFDQDIFFLTQKTVEPISLGVYGFMLDVLNGWSGSGTSQTTNVFLAREGNPYRTIYDDRLSFGRQTYVLPTYDVGVSNLEDFLFQMSQDFGIVYETSLYAETDTIVAPNDCKHLMQIAVLNPFKYSTLYLSNNSEAITNVEIEEQKDFANTLTVYSANGSSVRGLYGVKTDGTITDLPNEVENDFLAYNNCVNVTVASDDPVKNLIREYLGNAMLNHKITFDVDLTRQTYRFDDFKIGRSVNFFYGNRLFESTITALSFENSEGQIASLRVVLGNVRTKLTTKLNINIRKKKKR